MCLHHWIQFYPFVNSHQVPSLNPVVQWSVHVSPVAPAEPSTMSEAVKFSELTIFAARFQQLPCKYAFMVHTYNYNFTYFTRNQLILIYPAKFYPRAAFQRRKINIWLISCCVWCTSSPLGYILWICSEQEENNSFYGYSN